MQDAEACQRISFTAAILEPTRGAALEVWPIREHETKEPRAGVLASGGQSGQISSGLGIHEASFCKMMDKHFMELDVILMLRGEIR